MREQFYPRNIQSIRYGMIRVPVYSMSAYGFIEAIPIKKPLEVIQGLYGEW